VDNGNGRLVRGAGDAVSPRGAPSDVPGGPPPGVGRPGGARGRGTWLAAGAGLVAALVPSLAMWGFTVDDALVAVRYAHHLATGAGYRFDATGPSTDGVTPLPWAFLLSLAARGDALVTLERARVLGVVAWAAAGAALGRALVAELDRGEAGAGDGGEAGAGDGGEAADAGTAHEAGVAGGARGSRWDAAAALAVLALAFPLGAGAGSGVETGLAMALATVAATSTARPRRAAALAGVAATLRPELVVWGTTLAFLAATIEAPAGRARAREVAASTALAAGPFALCAAVRLCVFGRAAPLAVLAKPSDLEHGLRYASAAVVVMVLPLLALAPLAIARSRQGPARILAVAFLAHLLAVIACGGDWMPYARLLVPVAPSLALVFVASARHARPSSRAIRAILAVGLGVLFAARAAPAGRSVAADRAALIARARPVLASSRVVATLDVGWVSASTDARIVDLAGLTDPSIAMLPGGHTSKRVDATMLLDRGVDTVILYADARVVEARLLRSELFASRFERVEALPLGTRSASYDVYRRREVSASSIEAPSRPDR